MRLDLMRIHLYLSFIPIIFILLVYWATWTNLYVRWTVWCTHARMCVCALHPYSTHTQHLYHGGYKLKRLYVIRCDWISITWLLIYRIIFLEPNFESDNTWRVPVLYKLKLMWCNIISFDEVNSFVMNKMKTTCK